MSLNALPLTMLLGRFNGNLYSIGFWGSGTNWIDSIDHILLDCPDCLDLRAESFSLFKQDVITLEAKTF